MPYEQTEAIVLRKVDFSETSRIVTFLTPHRGKLACMAKGARRQGSPMMTLLDTYNRLDVTFIWKDSRQVQLLTEAALIDGYAALKKDVTAIACAAFLLEIAGLAAQENNPAPELFRALCDGLQTINSRQCAPFQAAAAAVCATLDAAGFAPDTNDTLFREIAGSVSGAERTRLAGAMEALRTGADVPAQDMPLLFRYLSGYATHHFERTVKSHDFLAALLREGC